MEREGMKKACLQLEGVFSAIERHLGHLEDLATLLDEDLSLIQRIFRTSEVVWSPSIHLLFGAIQGETSTVVEHQTRLKQLMLELDARPNSPMIEPLLLRFSRLFAAHQDSQWIEQQPNPEFHTERLVEGMLPSQTRTFLSGEAQLMIGKFAASCTSWPLMRERLVGHRHWIECMMATLPPGHVLSHPLVLIHHLVGEWEQRVQHQIDIGAAHEELGRLQQSIEASPGEGRVFAMERLRLQSMVVPFSNIKEEEA